MNLRLGPEAEEAVRHEAERTGRSQQEVIREAVGRLLGLPSGERTRDEIGMLLDSGMVRGPRTSYKKISRRLTLPAGITSADLLDRDDRI